MTGSEPSFSDKMDPQNPDDSAALTLETIHNVDALDKVQWDKLANPSGLPYDPFISFDFLNALESSNTLTPETGWAAHHLVLKDSAGRLRAAMPLYLTAHSQGEYIFDHAWAEAFYRVGGQYYPKLLAAIPFTPVTGRRFMVGNDHNVQTLKALLVKAAIERTESHNLSSLHINFLPETDTVFLKQKGFLHRTGVQFHWENQGYGDFDAFLANLASKKRRNLKKERIQAQSGLDIQHLTGKALTKDHWDHFYTFYMDTGARKWGMPYLNRQTFSLLHKTMADQILLILAFEESHPIAGALHFIGSDTLYGRYWGCAVDKPFLHFELCYYQAIDYAIANGLKHVEAGAQGEHKLARGYAPKPIHSTHWITHSHLRDAIANYLDQERQAMIGEIHYLDQLLPFKKHAKGE